jgi:UDP-N-acetylglucosamine 2-epimerase (non-hydrolysing)
MVVDTLGDVADELDCPVLVSTHPRTRKRLDEAGIGDRPDIVFHEPFGLLDYMHLQTHARCVLSDSGTISEESAILGFPAVTLRDAIERPEALEAGSIISSGLESEVVVAAVRQVLAQRAAGETPDSPAEYRILDFSQRVVNIIRSTMHTHHAWDGIRRRSAAWGPDRTFSRTEERNQR